MYVFGFGFERHELHMKQCLINTNIHMKHLSSTYNVNTNNGGLTKSSDKALYIDERLFSQAI